MTRVLIASVILATSAAASGLQQKEWSFPDTRKQGRATAEYRSRDRVHFVVNYDYSQRNHKTKWLLIDLAAASRRRFVLNKEHIRLLTPNGRDLPVAPQEAIIDDSAGVTSLLQNASIFRRPLVSYFSQRDVIESIRFQTFPIGGGTVSPEAIVDEDRVAIGGVLFRTPEGSWDAGTYRLEITNEVAKAALPIVLE